MHRSPSWAGDGARAAPAGSALRGAADTQRAARAAAARAAVGGGTADAIVVVRDGEQWVVRRGVPEPRRSHAGRERQLSRRAFDVACAASRPCGERHRGEPGVGLFGRRCREGLTGSERERGKREAHVDHPVASVGLSELPRRRMSRWTMRLRANMHAARRTPSPRAIRSLGPRLSVKGSSHGNSHEVMPSCPGDE
jgi:hypothetical protein